MNTPLRSRRTPIAWLQSTHQPVKLMVAIAGVCFSNLLIFFQLGLMDSLYNSQRKPIDLMQADLIMLSSRYVNLASLVPFERANLYQTLGASGVEYVTPMRIGRSRWLNPSNKKTYDIYVYGINPTYPSFEIPEVVKNNHQLHQLRKAIFDRHSKPHYGDVALTVKQYGRFDTEVHGRAVSVIDTFMMGATFAADANLIVGDSTFLYLFPEQNADQIQVGLIRLKPGTVAQDAKKSLRQILRDDVQILTKKEFAELEMQYWKKNSSVGFIFSIGVLVGFIVGSIIVYQILYSDVTASLAQYATLKAMGYSDVFVISIVIQQSAIFAAFGFVPGILLSFLLYNVLANATKLAIYMTLHNAMLVLILTFVMCVGSGILATKKLIELDPAEVF